MRPRERLRQDAFGGVEPYAQQLSRRLADFEHSGEDGELQHALDRVGVLRVAAQAVEMEETNSHRARRGEVAFLGRVLCHLQLHEWQVVPLQLKRQNAARLFQPLGLRSPLSLQRDLKLVLLLLAEPLLALQATTRGEGVEPLLHGRRARLDVAAALCLSRPRHRRLLARLGIRLRR